MIGEAILTILGYVAGGIIGNRADSRFVDIKKAFPNTENMLINHDLQKAVYRSLCFAKISICKECRKKEKENTKAVLWLTETIRDIKAEVGQIKDGNNHTVLPFLENVEEIKKLLATEWTNEDNQKELIKYAKYENCDSRLYNRFVEKYFYQKVCGFFAYSIKHDDIVNNIFQSQVLANSSIKLDQVINTLSSFSKSILSELKDINEGIEEIKLAVKKESESLRGKIDDRFSEIIDYVKNHQSTVNHVENASPDIDQAALKVANVFAVVQLYSLLGCGGAEKCLDTGFTKIFPFTIEDGLVKLNLILQAAIEYYFSSGDYTISALNRDIIIKQLFSLENVMRYVSARHGFAAICQKTKEILIENNGDSFIPEYIEGIIEKIINITADQIEDHGDLKSVSEYRFSNELSSSQKILMNFMESKQNLTDFQIHRFAVNRKKEIIFFPVKISGGSKDFFGRDEELAEMWDAFNAGKQIVVLWGMDGIGKTKIADNFLAVYEKVIGKTHKVKRIQGNSSSLVHAVIEGFNFPKNVIKDCSQCLEKEKEYELKKVALRDLAEDELIFIDSVDRISGSDINDLKELRCRFIIASRKKIDSEEVENIAVKELGFLALQKMFESKLNTRINADDAEKLRRLFANVNYHTYTIALLVDLMIAHKKTIDDLLKISEDITSDNSKIEYLDDSNTIIGYLKAIYENAQINPSEQRFLENLALVSSKGIDADKFREWLHIENHNEINTLSKLSWVIFDEAALNIRLHPIIASTLLAMNVIVPDHCAETINGIIAMLDFSKYSALSFVEMRNLLEYGEYLEKILERINCVNDRLQERLAEGYTYLGEHEKSLVVANSMINSPNKINMMMIIAKVSISRWDYDAAITRLYEAVEYVNDDYFKLGSAYIDIAKCYLAVGDNYSASGAFHKAYDSYMKMDDPHAFGVGLVLMDYFLCTKYNFHFSALLRKYKKLVLRNAGNDPNGIILYLMVYFLYIAKKKKLVSSNRTDEFVQGVLYVSERYDMGFLFKHFLFLKKYKKKMDNAKADSLRIVKGLFDPDFPGGGVQEAGEILKMLEWMELRCSEIGQKISVVQALGIMQGFFPELSLGSEVIYGKLEDKLRCFEQQLIFDNTLYVQSVIAFEQFKSRLFGNSIEFKRNIDDLLLKQKKILPEKNQYSLAVSYEALGDWYLSKSMNKNKNEWLKMRAIDYFNNALEIKRGIDVNIYEKIRLENKLGIYKYAMDKIEWNISRRSKNKEKGLKWKEDILILKDYKNCTMCKSFVVLAESFPEKADRAKEIQECIREVNRISSSVSICSRMCLADTLYRLACSLRQTGIRTRRIYFEFFLLHLKSLLITSQFVRRLGPNEYAIQNYLMIINFLRENNYYGIAYFFIREALVIVQKGGDYKTMTTLLIDYFDDKKVDELFVRYGKRKIGKLKTKKSVDNDLAQMLYSNKIKDVHFSLFILQQINTLDYQEAIRSVKKIPLLITRIEEMLFDSYFSGSSRFDNTIKQGSVHSIELKHNAAKPWAASKKEKKAKSLSFILHSVNEKEGWAKSLKDEDFPRMTGQFRKRYKDGESLDDLLPEAFALVREAARRKLGERPYDVQIRGSIALHQGKIAEMKNGEGKTLMCVAAAYLNAIPGEGVHVVTVNDYLAKRDAGWMRQVYTYLGVTVGFILSYMDNDMRRSAYNCDVTYGTNNEFGFDYLRDNMRFSAESRVQRNHYFCIVDEVDSILIDEARSPLIISGEANNDASVVAGIDSLARELKEVEKTESGEYIEKFQSGEVAGDYTLNEKNKSVTFTDRGFAAIEYILRAQGLISGRDADEENFERYVHYFTQAVRAHKLCKIDVDYIVQRGQVKIVDEFTGRILEGRRYSDGLHQAIEAKEHITIAQRRRTMATITAQNFFRMYKKLSGTTGTADTEAKEFKKIYDLDVEVIPTNLPIARRDEDDEVYLTRDEKWKAICDEILKVNKKGQPLLVGTVSIEKSEYLSSLLTERGIRHEVLNAKNHEREAQIIAEAGVKGAVTVATNMAGRGTDIKLGGNVDFRTRNRAGINAAPEQYEAAYEIEYEKWKKNYEEVKNLGGLCVIGTERHESRRIDNQLRGRSGRQGDPGRSKFFLSMEDDLMRLFGGESLKGMMSRLGVGPGEPINHPLLNKSIEKAQKKVEERYFEIRKHLLEYDDVLNEQRNFIYEQRDSILADDNLRERIFTTAEESVDEFLEQYEKEFKKSSGSAFSDLQDKLKTDFSIQLESDAGGTENLRTIILEMLRKDLAKKEALAGKEIMNSFIRRQYVQAVDEKWLDHLGRLEALRETVHLRSYGSKNPLAEYKLEGFEIFYEMLDSIRREIASKVFRMRGGRNDTQPPGEAGNLEHSSL